MTRAITCVIFLLGLMLAGICSSCGSEESESNQGQSLLQEDTLLTGELSGLSQPTNQPATPLPPPIISEETKKVIEKQKDESLFKEKGCCNDEEKTLKENCCCKEVLAAYKKMVDTKDKNLVNIKLKDPILQTCRNKHPKEFAEVDYPPGSDDQED